MKPSLAERKKHNINGHNAGWFYDDCWRCTVHLIWPVNGKKMAEYCLDQFDAKADEGPPFSARCMEVEATGFTQGPILISMLDWKPDAIHMSNLSHECFHATQFILESRGMKLCPETQEAFAYLHESIFARCLEILGFK